jgi:hypothetical protein
MSVSQLAYLGIGVSDMPAWKSFATDILGRQVTERGDDGTVYLRMDESHHRIALHRSGEDDVLYVGLQAPTHARYEEARSALRAAGVPVTPRDIGRDRPLLGSPPREQGGVPVVSTLGRHSNDQMVSFYMSTPSGFEVEYGWGGRLVDDATWQVQRHDRGTLWGHKIQLEVAPHPVAR